MYILTSFFPNEKSYLKKIHIIYIYIYIYKLLLLLCYEDLKCNIFQ